MPLLPPSPRKYRQILEQLQGEILRGDYRTGDKLPSEADLIKRFGASRITVGRAVNELRNLGLVERRAGSGTYVRPPASESRNADASANAASASAGLLLFGLLIPDLGRTDIFEPICQGMAEAPQSDKFALLWGHAPAAPITREERAWQVCQRFIERGADGVFFAPFDQPLLHAEDNLRLLVALDEARIPVVLLDRDTLRFPRRSAHDLVGLDNRRAGYLATEHLLRLGRKRIVFAAPADTAATVDARIAGYREALFAEEHPGAPSVQRFDPADATAIRQMLDGVNPDALVCANDRTAGQLMHGLQALGRRVPQDVALVGIDDVDYASLLPVPLTTVRQPTREIGAAAVAAMLERVRRPSGPPRDILLDGTLVVRASCGAKAGLPLSPELTGNGEFDGR